MICKQLFYHAVSMLVTESMPFTELVLTSTLTSDGALQMQWKDTFPATGTSIIAPTAFRQEPIAILPLLERYMILHQGTCTYATHIGPYRRCLTLTFPSARVLVTTKTGA